MRVMKNMDWIGGAMGCVWILFGWRYICMEILLSNVSSCSCSFKASHVPLIRDIVLMHVRHIE